MYSLYFLYFLMTSQSTVADRHGTAQRRRMALPCGASAALVALAPYGHIGLQCDNDTATAGGVGG